MKLLSLNVGLPREVTWRRERVLTSIFKDPVVGPVRVGTLNLEGDRQSDLTVHGGTFKAVYAYPSEHYGFWREALPDVSFPAGAFGENLTIEGCMETDARIGDRLGIGSAEFIVTQPRMPCYKLGVRFDRLDMVKHFARSGRSGFYLRVAREGAICAGDAITWLSREAGGATVADVFARNLQRG